MIKVLERRKFSPIHAVTGDRIVLYYTDPDGVKHEVANKEIDFTMVVDTAVIFRFEDMFGLKEGFGGVFGHS